MASVQKAIEHIYALVYEFRKSRTSEEMHQLQLKQQHQQMMTKLRDELEDGLAESVPSTPASTKSRKTRNRTYSKSSKSSGGGGDGGDHEQQPHPPKKKRCVARVEKSTVSVEFDDMDEDAKRLLMDHDSSSIVMCGDDAENLIEGPDESDDIIDNELIEEELMVMYNKM